MTVIVIPVSFFIETYWFFVFPVWFRFNGHHFIIFIDAIYPIRTGIHSVTNVKT